MHLEKCLLRAEVLLFRQMFIDKIKRKALVFGVTLLLALTTLPMPIAAGEKSSVDASVDSILNGNRILIATSDAGTGAANHLAKILQELYGAEVIIKTTDKYTSFIDESAFDAFVYYGSEYAKTPRQNFIDDMERTAKPILWVNYHGWELNKKYFRAKGISILDQHDSSYIEVEMQDLLGLTQTDTTLIKSDPEKVIYFLRSTSGEQIPGAVHADNYTFVAYSPNLDIFSPDFYPFLMAIRAAFGDMPAPTKRVSLDYHERIIGGRKDSFRTGVHLPVYVASTQDLFLGYENDKLHENLVRIKDSGAEWVNLVRTFYQTDVHSADIHADEQLTPRLDTLNNIIHDAHELGLKIQLHLAINLEKRGPDDWHGMIRPKNRKQWWTTYQELVLEMADFSKRNEVESLIIGTEYTALQSDVKNWRALIKAIREQARYPGMVGYGVNFNSLELAWLDELDFLGISAYWPLSEDRDPDLQTLNKSWERINKQLDTWMKRHPSLRVEFSEVGYVSQPYSSVLPFSWKAHKGKARNLTEQLQTFRALHQFLKQEPKIKGVHIFASTTEDTDPDSRDYTPFGKPAEKVLKQIMHIR